MISHEEAQALISARLDGPLDPAANRALLAHLATCPSCRSFAEQTNTLARGLRDLPHLPPSPTVSRVVLERISEARSPWARFLDALQPARLATIATALALLLIGIVAAGQVVLDDGGLGLIPGAPDSDSPTATETRDTIALDLPTATAVPPTDAPTEQPAEPATTTTEPATTAIDPTAAVAAGQTETAIAAEAGPTDGTGGPSVASSLPTTPPESTGVDVDGAPDSTEPTVDDAAAAGTADGGDAAPDAAPDDGDSGILAVLSPLASPTAEPTETRTPEPTETAAPTPTDTATPEPTQTATPQPSATPTEAPTATALPTETPVPTATPEPTAPPTDQPTATQTPRPTSTPESTETPVPPATATNTPAPTDTPAPSPTPEPTATPEPTSTPTEAPTATPEPTETPVPTATATDTPEPTATNTPEPTATPTEESTATPEPTETPEPPATPTPEPVAIEAAPTIASTETTPAAPSGDEDADGQDSDPSADVETGGEGSTVQRAAVDEEPSPQGEPEPADQDTPAPAPAVEPTAAPAPGVPDCGPGGICPRNGAFEETDGEPEADPTDVPTVEVPPEESPESSFEGAEPTAIPAGGGSDVPVVEDEQPTPEGDPVDTAAEVQPDEDEPAPPEPVRAAVVVPASGWATTPPGPLRLLPDGAVVALDGGGLALGLATFDGRLIPAGAGELYYPTPGPGGRVLVAFYPAGQDGPSVGVWDPTGGAVQQASFPDPARPVRDVPAGWLDGVPVYQRTYLDAGRVELRLTTGGSDDPVLWFREDLAVLSRHPLQVGGRFLLATDRGWLLASTDDTDQTLGEVVAGGEVLDAALSPDGAWLAYTDGGTLYAAPAANPGQVAAVAGYTHAPGAGYAWSPTGRYLAVGDGATLTIYDTGGVPIVTIPGPAGAPLGAPAWTAEGLLVAGGGAVILIPAADLPVA